MLLVGLGPTLGEGLAASGAVYSLAQTFDNYPLAVVCGPRTAIWYEANPKRFWTLVLHADRSRLSVQTELYRLLLFARVSAVADLAPHPALSLLPIRLSRGAPMSFSRKRGEPLGEAIERLGERLRPAGAPNSRLMPRWYSWRGPWPNKMEDSAAALLPGGHTRPWVAFAPAPADGEGEAWSPALLESLAEILFSDAGIFPGGRAAVLSAAGESAFAQPTVRTLTDCLDEARVRDLAASTGLVLASVCFERTQLVICRNRTAMQLAAAARVPALLLEAASDTSPSAERLLPLWANQKRLAFPCSTNEMGEALASLVAAGAPARSGAEA